MLSGLGAVLFLFGCTQEEKTVVLPGEETWAAEGEEDWGEGGFSVKRIYTFSYETSAVLEQSAFIQDCGENEIRVITTQEEEKEGMLEARMVDYRYGFYETEGEFPEIKEDWAEDGRHIGKMLASPDGEQILVYLSSDLSNYSAVQLHQLGAPKPWILYEGEGGAGRSSEGSFTPDGRWVTFDVSGIWMGEEMVVPVYDCLKLPDQPKIILDDSAQLYPPDLMLQNGTPSCGQLWEAQLKDFFGEVGRIGIDSESDGGLLFVEDFPGKRSSSRLAGGVQTSMAYLQYEFKEEENMLYYLAQDMQLWSMDLTQKTFGNPVVFKEEVLDFLLLETGEILVLAVPEQREPGIGGSDYIVNLDSIREADSRLMTIQKFWSIRSVDLYLYPAGGGEGELLYKDIRDLAAMEYDEENGRILLETFEDREAGKRKCLILELK